MAPVVVRPDTVSKYASVNESSGRYSMSGSVANAGRTVHGSATSRKPSRICSSLSCPRASEPDHETAAEREHERLVVRGLGAVGEEVGERERDEDRQPEDHQDHPERLRERRVARERSSRGAGGRQHERGGYTKPKPTWNSFSTFGIMRLLATNMIT